MHCISLSSLAAWAGFPPCSWHKLTFLCWRAVTDQSINPAYMPVVCGSPCHHLWQHIGIDWSVYIIDLCIFLHLMQFSSPQIDINISSCVGVPFNTNRWSNSLLFRFRPVDLMNLIQISRSKSGRSGGNSQRWTPTITTYVYEYKVALTYPQVQIYNIQPGEIMLAGCINIILYVLKIQPNTTYKLFARKKKQTEKSAIVNRYKELIIVDISVVLKSLLDKYKEPSLHCRSSSNWDINAELHVLERE